MSKQVELLKEFLGDALDKNYGRHRWDINNNLFDNTFLFIHYPKVEISNSNGEKHTITDLYVAVPFGIDNATEKPYVRGPMLGTRMSRTTVERSVNFVHSHLPSSNILGYFNAFCLGSGTTAMQSAINNLTPGDYTEECFDAFLFQLDRYVCWESLEGGPYMFICDINFGNNHIDYTDQAYNDMDEIVYRYQQGHIEIPFQYTVVDGCYISFNVSHKDPRFIEIMDKYSGYKGTRAEDGRNFITDISAAAKLKQYLRAVRDNRDCIKKHKEGEDDTYKFFKFNGKVPMPYIIRGNIGKIDNNKESLPCNQAHPLVIQYCAENLNIKLNNLCYGSQEKIKEIKYEQEEISGEFITSGTYTNSSDTSNYTISL